MAAGEREGAGPPVFVVGCPRSGTSLLAALLDRHSGLAVPPETFLFRDLHPELLSRSDRLRGEALIDFVLGHWPISALRLDREDLLRRVQADRPAHRDLFRAILDTYAAKRRKPRWVEKTPPHLFYVPLILEWYPDARILCVLRDGRDVALSLARARWTHGNLWLHALLWSRCARLTTQFRKSYPDRFAVVRFEELVTRPEKVLRDVAEFIQAPLEPGQLSAGGASESILEQELEWKAKALEPPDPDRVQSWKREASRRERRVLAAVMAPELEQAGYERDPEAAAGTLERICAGVYGGLFALRMLVYHPAVHHRVRRLQRLVRINR